MATKQRQDLELTLISVDVPSLGKNPDSDHLLTAELIWPRSNIANRVNEKQLALRLGSFKQQASWCERILFKETFEGNFGLHFDLSIPLSHKQLEDFLRDMAGNALKIGAKTLDDAIPGGDYAVMPINYLSKELLKIGKPAVHCAGMLDLNTATFSPDRPLQVQIPLLTTRDIIRTRRTGSIRTQIHYSRDTLQTRGAADGFIVVEVNVLT